MEFVIIMILFDVDYRLLHGSISLSPHSEKIYTLSELKSWPVNSKYTWKDNLAAIFEAKLKAAIDNRGVKK